MALGNRRRERRSRRSPNCHWRTYPLYDARKKDLLPGKLVWSEGEPKAADAAVTEAYDYSGDTFLFFFEVFGRNSLDDAGMSLIVSVHVGKADGSDRYQPMNNAFGDGSQMDCGRSIVLRRLGELVGKLAGGSGDFQAMVFDAHVRSLPAKPRRTAGDQLPQP